MAWFWRRRKKRPQFSPFDKSALPPVRLPDHDSALEEGVTMAQYTGRMTLKNAIMVNALRGNDYDAERFAGQAHALLDELASEQEQVSADMARTRGAAASRQGKAQHPHDYRPADERNLRLREEVSRDLATWLRRHMADEVWLAEYVERAREDAWRELSDAMDASLDAYAGVEAWRDDYERDKPDRLAEFLRRDLSPLQEERGDY